jgi:8-oxo-dGTP pyrophosphatase MutT (NUDIX family)
MPERRLQRLGSKTVYDGKLAKVRLEQFRYADGGTAEREVVGHPGAVAVVAHDGASVYLVRQPREPVDEPDLLEVPAGKLDVEGESHLECAKRELAEEIGRSATGWRQLKRFYPSPGILEEEVTVFLATGLEEVESNPDDDERLEVVTIPLAELDRAIEDCRDGKSLVGLLLLREELRRDERGA